MDEIVGCKGFYLIDGFYVCDEIFGMFCFEIVQWQVQIMIDDGVGKLNLYVNGCLQDDYVVQLVFNCFEQQKGVEVDGQDVEKIDIGLWQYEIE